MSESERAEPDEEQPILIGVSSCLLGEEVRFDGGHKRDGFTSDMLARYVSYLPVCPELEVGMGVPRETLRLVEGDDGPRMVTVKTGVDHTDSMRRWSRKRVRELGAEDLGGYILKKDSPSCGMERVKLYGKKGIPSKSGRGLYAEELMRRFPLLPVEEEGRLRDPRLRENFVERIFAYRRVKRLFAGRWSRGELVRFHTAEKLLLMAHDLQAYGRLGRLVADAKGRDRKELTVEYQSDFMGALKKIATTRKHTNVLHHIAGHFKKLIGSSDRQELAGLIDDFRRGLVPLVVPITLIRHWVRVHDVEYLKGQTYLEPHPKELMLRNHV